MLILSELPLKWAFVRVIVLLRLEKALSFPHVGKQPITLDAIIVTGSSSANPINVNNLLYGLVPLKQNSTAA
ncbi:MAG: hypothetical protein Fur0044_22130 [Anaerolineae bacterium]